MEELTPKQLRAIKKTLATAPDIRDDLKAKFGYGENKFFYLDLIEYRVNNSCEDIAEDLDLEERYDLINEQPRTSVGSAFRGHHNEDFLPDYKFKGLFGKVTNDYIENIRESINGRKAYELGEGIHAQTLEEKSELGRKALERGDGIHGRTPEERSEHSRKGGRKAYELGEGIHAQTPEERSELGRKANEAQGNHMWSLEEIADIGELKYGEGLTWNDTTSNMNEKYDKNWSTNQVKKAYHNNKDLLADEEE